MAKLTIYVIATLWLTACAPKSSDPAPSPQVDPPFSIRTHKNSKSAGLSAEALALFDGADGIAFDLKESCAESICGSPRTAVTPYEIVSGNPERLAATSQLMAQIKPSLQTLYNTTLDRQIRSLERIDERLAQLATVALPQDYAAIINLMWALSIKEKIAPTLRYENQIYRFDEAALISVTPELSSRDRQIMQSIVLDLYNSSELSAAKYIASIGLDDWLKLRFPGMSLEESKQLFTEELLVSVTGLQSRFPEMHIKTPAAVQSLADKKTLTLDQTQQLSQALLFKYMYRTLTQNISLLLQRPVPTEKIISDIRDSKVIAKLIKSAKEDKHSDPKFEETIKRCDDHINRALLAAPTNSDLKGIGTFIDKVKPLVIKAANDLIKPTPNVAAAIAANVNGTLFRFPNSRTEVYAAEIQAIANSVEDAQRALERVESAQDASLFFILYEMVSDGLDDITDSVSDECDRFSPGGVVDASWDSLKKIEMSWQTVRYPNFGAMVIAHEFGHVVSSAISAQPASEQASYANVKQCTDRRHNGAANLFAEEDFADIIAAHTLTLMNRAGIKADNVACLLLGTDKTRWGTNLGLAMSLPKTINANHSTDLYRAIQIQLNSGQTLSSSCQSVISTQPSSQLKCF